MTAFKRFRCFAEDLACGIHNLRDDVLKVALAVDEPDAVGDVVLDDVGEVEQGFGYDAGGLTTMQARIKNDPGFALALSAVTFKASGGIIGPFQYAVLYNATAVRTAAGRDGHPLIAAWKYRSSIHLEDGETFTWRTKEGEPVFRLG